jgi:hypothetical protein
MPSVTAADVSHRGIAADADAAGPNPTRDQVDVPLGEQPATTSLPATNADASGPHPLLRCRVALDFNVVVPPPLSVVPGPMLSVAGSLVSQLLLRNLMAGFLDLLALDYQRRVRLGLAVVWCGGVGLFVGGQFVG